MPEDTAHLLPCAYLGIYLVGFGYQKIHFVVMLSAFRRKYVLH